MTIESFKLRNGMTYHPTTESLTKAVIDSWGSEWLMRELLYLAAIARISRYQLSCAVYKAWPRLHRINPMPPSDMVANGLGSMMMRHGIKAPFPFMEETVGRDTPPSAIYEQLLRCAISPTDVATAWWSISRSGKSRHRDMVKKILLANGIKISIFDTIEGILAR